MRAHLLCDQDRQFSGDAVLLCHHVRRRVRSDGKLTDRQRPVVIQQVFFYISTIVLFFFEVCAVIRGDHAVSQRQAEIAVIQLVQVDSRHMEQSKKEIQNLKQPADKQNVSNSDTAVSKKKHSHAGHRERMRLRFQKSGLESFQPHEILELLLFYALPRVDTNPIAHDLIAEFHSLSGVLDADIQDLKRIKGISENAAIFLKLLPQLCQQYQLDKLREHVALDSTQKLCAYVQAKLSATVEEKVLLLCLDEHLHLLHCETISTGTAQRAALDTHRIVECTIRMRSSRVVLAHNHPQGQAAFSDADLFATQQLRRILDSMQIQLLDHIVLGKQGDTISMRQVMGWSDS